MKKSLPQRKFEDVNKILLFFKRYKKRNGIVGLFLFFLMYVAFNTSVPKLILSRIVATHESELSQTSNKSESTINQNIHVEVKGIETTTIASASAMSTFIDPCNNTEFSEGLWETSSYHKDNDAYYMPNNKSRDSFLYPPFIYKNKISAVFKKIHIEYVASHQEENSTQSATLYIALQQDGDKRNVFLGNLPEPNRQLLLFKTEIFPETPPKIAPTPIPPINLPTRLSINGTHEIIITTVKGNNSYDTTVTYILSGYYMDDNNNKQKIYRELPVRLNTVDPSIKEYTFIIGTGRLGKLKIKKFSLCDQ